MDLFKILSNVVNDVVNEKPEQKAEKADDQQLSLVEASVGMVMKFLEEYGFDEEESRISIDHAAGWAIRHGSASIFIIIGHNEIVEDITLEVFAPILKLPPTNILPFYRRCLELNRYLVNCALCVQKEKVLVISERSLIGLDYSELESLIATVAKTADMLDDDLAEEFGAQWISRD